MDTLLKVFGSPLGIAGLKTLEKQKRSIIDLKTFIDKCIT